MWGGRQEGLRAQRGPFFGLPAAERSARLLRCEDALTQCGTPRLLRREPPGVGSRQQKAQSCGTRPACPRPGEGLGAASQVEASEFTN